MVTPVEPAVPENPEELGGNSPNSANGVKPAEVWTYERRLALHIIGVMGLDFPGLPDEMFMDGGDPSALHGAIDTVADALIDGMHVLGCPPNLSLAQILDHASSHNFDGGAA